MTTEIELILGNSNKRFSGVTSTMLQVLAQQKKLCGTAVLGAHHLASHDQALTFKQFIKLTKQPLANGRYRVFHARRNDEMIQALIAKKFFGAKIKIAFTSTAQRKHSRFSRWLMQQMDGVISTCSAAAAYLDHRPPDIIIPHGIDVLRYTPAKDKSQAWQSLQLTGNYGVGIFGRVRHSKGIDIFIEAALQLAPKFPQAIFVIGGECIAKDLTYQQALQQKIADAGYQSRFKFLGKRPFNELPKLFSAMTVICALSRNEGFGLTPLEAMASGTAVLTSEAGAWRDIVHNGVNGYCVATDNIEATTQALDLLLSDLPTTLTMGLHGRANVLDNYTIEQEAASLTRFLLSLAN